MICKNFRIFVRLIIYEWLIDYVLVYNLHVLHTAIIRTKICQLLKENLLKFKIRIIIAWKPILLCDGVELNSIILDGASVEHFWSCQTKYL